jgi:hypothetical protein
LGRWLSGELKGLPYPDHCRVLEKMFPGWTIEQLFEELDADDTALSESAESPQHAANSDSGGLVRVIEKHLDEPQANDADWGPAERSSPLLRGSLVTAVSAPDIEGASDDARQLAHRLLELKQLRRLDGRETRQLTIFNRGSYAGGRVRCPRTAAGLATGRAGPGWAIRGPGTPAPGPGLALAGRPGARRRPFRRGSRVTVTAFS